jgi:DNA-binding transcriptional LysR family regulator
MRHLTFNVKFEVLHVHTLIAFAREGLGIAILPKIAIPEPCLALCRRSRSAIQP